MAEDAYDNSASVLGTEWHLKKMFQRIPEAKLFHNKGKRVKKSRWMSVWDALEIFLPYWTIFCLVLVWTCQKYGILKAISDLPQNDSFNAAAPNPESLNAGPMIPCIRSPRRSGTAMQRLNP